MGDIADMMIDGTLCGGCGCYMSGGAYGVPRFCGGCGQGKHQAKTAKVACPTCGKKVKAVGLSDHVRDSHAISQAARTAIQSATGSGT